MWARAPKIRGKYFSGTYYIKFWHFSGKNHVNSGILLIFHTFFSGKNVVPP